MAACGDSISSEKLSRRCRRSIRIVKALPNYILKVENPRNGQYYYIQANRLKFYQESSLDMTVKLLCVLCFETSIELYLRMKLVTTRRAEISSRLESLCVRMTLRNHWILCLKMSRDLYQIDQDAKIGILVFLIRLVTFLACKKVCSEVFFTLRFVVSTKVLVV